MHRKAIHLLYTLAVSLALMFGAPLANAQDPGMGSPPPGGDKGMDSGSLPGGGMDKKDDKKKDDKDKKKKDKKDKDKDKEKDDGMGGGMMK